MDLDDNNSRREDCDICGERYHNEAIQGYMRQRANGSYICFDHPRKRDRDYSGIVRHCLRGIICDAAWLFEEAMAAEAAGNLERGTPDGRLFRPTAAGLRLLERENQDG